MREHLIPATSGWTNVNHNEKKGHKGISEQVDTFKKRGEELESHVLPQSDYKEAFPVSKKPILDENVEGRRHHQTYSDLYG